MKIPQTLHQFQNESALIIESGTYAARIFTARNGQIKERRFEHSSSREDYSDREEFWRMGQRKSKKGAWHVGAWSTYEHHKGYLYEKFLHNLRRDTLDLFQSDKINRVYILAPRYIFQAIKNHALHPYLSRAIIMHLDGDYHYYTIKEILSKITDETEKRISEEVQRMEQNLKSKGLAKKQKENLEQEDKILKKVEKPIRNKTIKKRGLF